MCDHDYDGLLPKSGKRHLGKTRWTREEVTNHVTKMWKKPGMYQFMKNKKSTKLEVLKFIGRLFEMLPWHAWAACLPLTLPHIYIVSSISQPLCSSLNVLSLLYASSVFPSAYSVLASYPTMSY